MKFPQVGLKLLLVLAVAGGLWWWQGRDTAPTTRRPNVSPAVVEVRREVHFIPAPGTSRFRIRMTRIPTFAGQRVLTESWNIPPTDSGIDPSGEWFGWDVAHPDSELTFLNRVRVEVLNAGLSASPRSTLPLPEPGLFLASDSLLHPDDESIRGFAEPLRRTDTTNTLRAVWEAVVARLSYEGYVPDDRGSREALRKGSGDCSEYADLFAATTRALGIPTRRITGWVTKSSGTAKHAWVEAWIPSRGWTAFDPLWGETGMTTFEHVPTPRVSLSWIDPGSAKEGRTFTAWRWWGEPPKVSSRDTLLPVTQPHGYQE